jgi:hypothetical protein
MFGAFVNIIKILGTQALSSYYLHLKQTVPFLLYPSSLFRNQSK